MKIFLRSISVLSALFCLATSGAVSAQKSISSFDRDRGRIMLSNIKGDLKKSYYDLNYHGMDVDARFAAAD